jgi:hypothetical protein
MKVAVCLSGHLRKFDRTFPTLWTYLLRYYDCDLFVHTWDRMGYLSAYKGDSIIDDTSKYLPKVESLYKPKKIIVESSIFIEELKKQGDKYAPHLKDVPKHVGHMASMFYKIYAANELRRLYQIETGVQYDWVIRCRPDLKFHGKTLVPDQKKPKHIYIPTHQCHYKWFGDQFAIGLPEDMDLYSSFFFHIPEYFKYKNEYRPERFMDWCLTKLELVPLKWDCHFDILR